MSERLTASVEPEFSPDFQTNKYPESPDPTILTGIFDQDTHITVWKRTLPLALRKTVSDFVDTSPGFRASVATTPDNALAALNEFFDDESTAELCEDVANLVAMFCMLFDQERAGTRLSVLGAAMCPKFHVDRIPCRLLTTYQGVATEWLPNQVVNRSKLGHASKGKTDNESGLYIDEQDIQQLDHGDVAILKGDLWAGNEGEGLVHRSPLVKGERRLLLTLDFIN